LIETKMHLTPEETAMLKGEHGETIRKIMETLTRLGDAFDASRFVPLDGPSHLVGCYAVPATQPYVELVEALAADGIRTKFPFTANPLPLDGANITPSEAEQRYFDKACAFQSRLEANLAKIGMVNAKSYTCTCYLQEVGNTPKRGDNLAWAESSAVVFSNSVLGARTNRNAGIIDLFCAIVGRAPKYGFLTDEGRRARWVIDLATSNLPNPHLLGSAIGQKVMEQVPYIKGLDKFLGTELNAATKDYLKEMGASTASNGAVGLYHVDKLTPEAADLGDALIRDDAATYRIDDAELARIKAAYPLLWPNPDDPPAVAFVGCPHYSFDQLCHWTTAMEAELAKHGRDKLAVRTIFAAAVPVMERFAASEFYARFAATGALLSSVCPLLYASNPVIDNSNVITNSNKLRTYSKARFVEDDELLRIIVKGGA